VKRDKYKHVLSDSCHSQTVTTENDEPDKCERDKSKDAYNICDV
jgi:hypothetical protein